MLYKEFCRSRSARKIYRRKSRKISLTLRSSPAEENKNNRYVNQKKPQNFNN